ncbi:MAG: hypothetical protein M1819_000624 [Sarea resinae]|nr:MAG: hypothetical protein M1819_000624 [Sarea resinae]
MRLTTIALFLLPALARADTISSPTSVVSSSSSTTTTALVAAAAVAAAGAQTSISPPSPSPAADMASSIPLPVPTNEQQAQPLHPPSEEAEEAAPPQISYPPETLEQLELRAVMDNPNAAAQPTQANPMTTMWVQTEISPGVTTYVSIIFSQTFASVPSQAPTAKAGAVGMGTLTGKIGVVKTESASAGHRLRRDVGVFSGAGPDVGMVLGLVIGVAVGAGVLVGGGGGAAWLA